MSSLLAQIQQDLNAARKSQDKARTLLLSTILADAKNRRIELMKELTDDDVNELLRRGIKRRRESLEIYEKAGRADLAGIERTQVDMLSAYLPAMASDEELRAAVREAIGNGAAAIGAVMGAVLPRFKGKADGARINAIAREELARQG